MFPYFNLLGRTIGTYSVCALLGLLSCGAAAFLIGKKYGVMLADIILLMVSICAGMIIGGHLLYGITQYSGIKECLFSIKSMTVKNILSAASTFFGGSVFYGGFFGSLAAIFIHVKHTDTLVREQTLDIFSVVVPLFHIFGRIGCFLGGCCYGIESKFGFISNNNPLVPEITGVRRFPVQLAEAFANLCIFLILLYLFQNNKFYGKLIYVYMLLYSMCRFPLEFLRGDSIRGRLFMLSTSQWISIAVFISSAIILLAKSFVCRKNYIKKINEVGL